MKLKKIIGVSVITVLLCLTGCTNKNATSEHEAVTILAPYLECDRLADLVHEKYPEVNLEILSYSGANTTQYLQNMLAADDLPDICTQTVYDPNINDMSDKMIDLSSYDFTDNYVESRLQDVSADGAWKTWQRKQRRQGYNCAWRRLHIRVTDFNICAILQIRDFWELFRASSGKRII